MRSLSLLLLAAALTISVGWCGAVNVNAADAQTLAQELKGVGPVKAQRLVEYRQRHGAFHSIDEIAQVKGFSQKLIERNRAELRLGPVAAAAPAAAPRQAPRPASGH